MRSPTRRLVVSHWHQWETVVRLLLKVISLPIKRPKSSCRGLLIRHMCLQQRSRTPLNRNTPVLPRNLGNFHRAYRSSLVKKVSKRLANSLTNYSKDFSRQACTRRFSKTWRQWSGSQRRLFIYLFTSKKVRVVNAQWELDQDLLQSQIWLTRREPTTISRMSTRRSVSIMISILRFTISTTAT